MIKPERALRAPSFDETFSAPELGAHAFEDFLGPLDGHAVFSRSEMLLEEAPIGQFL